MISKRTAIDVGIVVTDMGRSLQFYRDIVGLPVVAEVITSLVGKGRMVQLTHGESLIKLLEMEIAPSTQSPSGITRAFGYRYISLLVADVVAMMESMKESGVPIVIPVTQVGSGSAIAMVEDPDGNIVEFVQEA